MKEKVFYYGNYNGFRYTATTPTSMTFPDPGRDAGRLQRDRRDIYDPRLTGLLYRECQRRLLPLSIRLRSSAAGTAKGPAGDPVADRSQDQDPLHPVLADRERNAVVFPAVPNAAGCRQQLHSPNAPGLVNWSMTHRIDYIINSRDTLSVVGAVGRQASSIPVGQTTAGRNVGPLPLTTAAYAPKTAVDVRGDACFLTHLLNQFKWGYARYNGPPSTPTRTRLTPPATWLGLEDCRPGRRSKPSRS